MPQLDAVRGFAVLLVMFEHLGGPVVRTHFPLSAGALGVNLFFVLSGFLISGILFAEIDRERGRTGAMLGRFFLRRSVRLIPAYYVVLLILAVLGINEVRGDLLWHVTYSSNFLVAAGGPMLPFWSLAVEEQFYLILPFILLLAGRHRLGVGIGLVATGLGARVLAYLAGTDPTSFELLLPGKLEVLGAGVVLGALCYANGRRAFSWIAGRGGRILGVAAAAALALELIIFYTTPIEGIGRYFTFTLTSGVYFGWVVVRAARGFTGWIAWVLEHPVLRYVGRISYTLYLVHSFIPEILRLPAAEAVTGELPLPVLAILSFGLSFVVATVSWLVLERPLLRMAHAVGRPSGGAGLAVAP
jgi:peptidoglycan/LPS O-acetylase OafA/YrhL